MIIVMCNVLHDNFRDSLMIIVMCNVLHNNFHDSLMIIVMIWSSQKIRDKIEEVREKDLSLDELENEDSLYIFEDRLQKKFIKVWNKLCLLKGRSTSSGRPIERRFKYEGKFWVQVCVCVWNFSMSHIKNSHV